MPDKAASLSINEVNLSFTLGTGVTRNVSGVTADCEFGPIGVVDEIITNSNQFAKVYGGLRADKSNLASYNNCIRALNRGSALRVNNVKHYTDISDKSTLTAIKAAAAGTKTYTISATLAAYDSLVGTFGAYGQTITQAYSVSAANTIDLFLLALKASSALAGYSKVLYAKRVTGSSTKFVIVFSDPTQANFIATSTSTKPIDLVITAGGTGYTNGTFPYTVTGGSGTGATGNLTVAGGIVTAITATSGGINYTGSVTIVAAGLTGGTGFTYTTTNHPNKTIATATSNAISNAEGDVLLSFDPKYAGAKYNDLTVFVTANARGAEYFDITISLLNSQVTPEFYPGLKISNLATDTTFMDSIKKASKLVIPVYHTATQTGAPIPLETFLAYGSGSNGSTITESDIVGNSNSKLGVYAFDGYDDVARVANFIDTAYNSMNSTTIESAFANYATLRKVIHFAKLHGADYTTVKAERDSWAINSSFSRCYADGLGLIVPNSDNVNDTTYLPCLGDVVGVAAYSAQNFKPWLSYAGQNRGQIINNLGVGNSWGADQDTLDLFAKSQINVVVRENGKTIVKGNFTMQMDLNALSFANIRDLLLFMADSLKPLAGVFLEEPNDIPTWRAIYAKIIPWKIALEDGRAIWKDPEAKWYGDQDATSLNDLVINTKTDVQLGKYQAKFLFMPINSLQQFGIGLIIADSNVSFEEILPTSNINN